ncbi:MAG TPA: hypothetical protein VKP30_25075 [Polyangiaceae bacterium]|nr:hypothetical protein [Polyangiaceae bacterium]
MNGNYFQPRLLGSLGLLVLAAATTGCLDRPVAATKPETNNVFVKQNPSGGIDKIDILFMIDNSLSMGDKQQVLKAAVPQLLGRLTNPDCVDIDPTDGTAEPQQMPNPTAPCTGSLQREFAPVKDIHIGVVTSSLGDYGGDTCPEGPPGSPAEAMNDHAWLLGHLPRTEGKLSGDFLKWTGTNVTNFESDIVSKQTEFGNFVTAASELGCGNEMTLEGWYRFLIDPKPPQDVVIIDKQGPNTRDGLDQAILDMRAEFLRPDSLVAIFMLTDENDCSMKDQGNDVYSWVAMTQTNGHRMWRGSSVCDQDPNNECCFSCMLADRASAECRAKDPGCAISGDGVKVAAAADDVNVRCRSMKKRFGYDFLFPASRYVNALTKKTLCPDQDYGDLDCDCTEAKKKKLPCTPGQGVLNPLYVNLNKDYTPTGPERTGPDAVFLAGVVGVPWQDLATDPSAGASLEYMTASQLANADGTNRWDWFSPKVDEDYSTAQLGDPFMIESTEPRDGTHPLTGDKIQPPEAGRMANKINGHEWKTSGKDTQFACIFPLDVQLEQGKNTATRVCDVAAECGEPDETDAYKTCARRMDGCSCVLSEEGGTKSPLDPTESLTPLCQNAQGSYGKTQYYAKAYPGLRELQVLRGYYEATKTDNAIVGSICPKDLEYANREKSGYGYNPAVKSLVDRLKEKLGGTCLPRALTVQADGKVPCAIVEAMPQSAEKAGWCACESHGRTSVGKELTGAIRAALEREAICGKSPLPDCNSFCLCKLEELLPNSDAGRRCLNELNVEKNTEPPGFCYVDPAIPDHGSAQIVSGCPGSQKRIIRIVGNSASDKGELWAAPAPGRVFIACSGAAREGKGDE